MSHRTTCPRCGERMVQRDRADGGGYEHDLVPGPGHPCHTRSPEGLVSLLDVGEVVQLTDGGVIHHYAARRPDGYRLTIITPDPDGGLPAVGCLPLGPAACRAWLHDDLASGWREHTEGGEPS